MERLNVILFLGRKWIMIAFLIFNSIYSFSQTSKPIIDFDACKKWVSVNPDALISNDGLYFSYTITEPFEKTILVLQGIDDNWKLSLPNYKLVSKETLCFERKQVLVKKGDSVFIVQLGTESKKFFRLASDIQFFERFLVYKDPKGRKSFLEEIKLKKRIDLGYDDYTIDAFGSKIIFTHQEGSKYSLTYYNPLQNRKIDIWMGNRIDNLIFDNIGNQLAFIERAEGKSNIWCYSFETKKAKLLMADSSPSLPSNIVIDKKGQFRFTKDNSKLLFPIIERIDDSSKKTSTKTDVTIWSYLDSILQSAQTVRPLNDSRLASVNVSDSKVFIFPKGYLSSGGDKVWFSNLQRTDLPVSSLSYFFTTEKTLKRVDRSIFKDAPTFSPNGQFALLFDYRNRKVIAHDFKTGEENSITEKTNTTWGNEVSDYELFDSNNTVEMPIVISWVNNEGVILQDTFGDLWYLSLFGREVTNLTKGYGRVNNIKFRFLLENKSNSLLTIPKTLILVGYNKLTKTQSYYKLLSSRMPILLSETTGQSDMRLIKSKDVNRYLVLRMSASTSPNYCFSDDLIRFKSLTSVFPESKYNWITSELHTWKIENNKLGQGILYKPENFSPSQKYPVIINYYNTSTQNLNLYHKPEPTAADINIPWFVSRGYIVLLVDMHFVEGNLASSAYKSLESAANYLEGLPFIDKTKMGLNGHSFGGWETNVFLTKTNRFSAAVSTSGLSNLYSFYNTIVDNYSYQKFSEIGQIRMKESPWRSPDTYYNNSPIFSVNKINTPLLLMANKKDLNVPYQQGLELFLAMRRLGKKVWMLEYNDNYHIVKDSDREDFTIRIQQFFDHYLKGMPPPLWLIKTVPHYDRTNTDKYLKIDTNTNNNINPK